MAELTTQQKYDLRVMWFQNNFFVPFIGAGACLAMTGLYTTDIHWWLLSSVSIALLFTAAAIKEVKEDREEIEVTAEGLKAFIEKV
jgi:hypothetical protein